MNGKKRIGVFGGSFNPIHNGHISLAQQLREKAGLDEVWLMVSPQNPLKPVGSLLPDEARLEMAQAAVEDEAGIVASDFELHLPRPSYTWNTLQALEHDYPNVAFTLLIGGDNWALFDRWYKADDIRRCYDIVVYPRAGYPGTVEAELIDISSTQIRELIRKGEPIDGLVPPQVARIISERGYYAKATALDI